MNCRFEKKITVPPFKVTQSHRKSILSVIHSNYLSRNISEINGDADRKTKMVT